MSTCESGLWDESKKLCEFQFQFRKVFPEVRYGEVKGSGEGKDVNQQAIKVRHMACELRSGGFARSITCKSPN
jgi:hypothetical protein